MRPIRRRVRVVFRGRVQGVGFRWFVRETAGSLGASGWVRNLPGGEVEAEVQADPGVLDALLRRLGTGHPCARVDGIGVRTLPAREEKDGEFEIR